VCVLDGAIGLGLLHDLELEVRGGVEREPAVRNVEQELFVDLRDGLRRILWSMRRGQPARAHAGVLTTELAALHQRHVQNVLRGAHPWPAAAPGL
jgi:hypothetical protein